MRTLFVTLMLSVMTLACGAEYTDNSLASPYGPQNTGIAKSIEGKITGLTSSMIPFTTPAGALGGMPRTDVTISYRVPCYASFEDFVSSAKVINGKAVIYVSAIISQGNHGQHVCQAFSVVEKKVSLEGKFTKEQIKLVNLRGGNAELTSDITDIVSTLNVKVTNTRSLCPEDMVCIMSGTIVDLEIEVSGCVNSVGPVSYSFVNQNGNLDLTVAAFDMVSRRNMVALCSEGPYTRKASIQLPNVFVDAKDISLNVVGKKVVK